jgi:hypothetical protein
MKISLNQKYGIIPIIILLLFFLAGCKQKTSISGQFDNCKQNYFVLYQILPNEVELMDTLLLLNGRFSHSIKNDQIGAYLMQFSDTTFIPFIADVGEKLIFSGDVNNLQNSYNVEGSEETDLLLINNRKLDTLYLETRKLSNEFVKYAYENYSNSVIAALDSMYLVYFNAHKEYLTGFIRSHPDKLASLFAFYQTLGNNAFFSMKEDADLLREIYPSLSQRYPNNVYVNDIKEKLEK